MLAAASTRGQLYFFFTNGAESSNHAGVYCVAPNLPRHWLMVDGKEMLIAPTVSAAPSGARVLLLFLHASGAWNWSRSVKPVVKLRMGTRRSEGRDRDRGWRSWGWRKRRRERRRRSEVTSIICYFLWECGYGISEYQSLLGKGISIVVDICSIWLSFYRATLPEAES